MNHEVLIRTSEESKKLILLDIFVDALRKYKEDEILDHAAALKNLRRLIEQTGFVFFDCYPPEFFLKELYNINDIKATSSLAEVIRNLYRSNRIEHANMINVIFMLEKTLEYSRPRRIRLYKN